MPRAVRHLSGRDRDVRAVNRARQSEHADRSSEDTITALRPIEVRTAAADAVPKVAAVLADAFINDPVFTWLLPGSLRLQPRLRAMFAAEMEQYVLPTGPCGRRPGTTAR